MLTVPYLIYQSCLFCFNLFWVFCDFWILLFLNLLIAWTLVILWLWISYMFLDLFGHYSLQHICCNCICLPFHFWYFTSQVSYSWKRWLAMCTLSSGLMNGENSNNAWMGWMTRLISSSTPLATPLHPTKLPMCLQVHVFPFPKRFWERLPSVMDFYFSVSFTLLVKRLFLNRKCHPIHYSHHL